MILFLLLTTMISDFSSVLLDVQDRAILLTRPVSVKTLNAAKLLYILYYLAGITLALAGVSLIVGLFKYGGWFFLTMGKNAVGLALIGAMVTTYSMTIVLGCALGLLIRRFMIHK